MQRYYDQGILILDLVPAPAPVRREQGNVIVKCDATSTGVFPYLLKDGTIRREARRPQEVFSADSMKSLAGVPFVVGHNYDGITPETIERVTAGIAGENVEALQAKESGNGVLRTTVNIFDQASIRRMDAGEVEVSCGYTARFVPEPGTLNGEAFDGYQDEIRYFEIAQVKDGRMNYGLERPAVRLLTDSADAAIQISKPRQEQPAMPRVQLKVSPPGKPEIVRTFDEVDPELADLVVDLVKAAQGKEPDGDEAIPGAKIDGEPGETGPGAVSLEMFKKLEAEVAQLKEMLAKMAPKGDGDAPPGAQPGEDKKSDGDAPPPSGVDPEKKADAALELKARELAGLIALGNGHRPGYKGLPEEQRKRLDSMKPHDIRRAVLADIRPDLAILEKGQKATRLDSMKPTEIQSVLEAELSRPATQARQYSPPPTGGNGAPPANPANRFETRRSAKS